MKTTKPSTAKRLLSGNEAIALGAWEAGARYAAAYPGTPSTEILPALANTIYNQGVACTMILDNGTTAMTGGQDNSATGVTLQGETTQVIDIESLVRAMEVQDLWVVDALDVKGVETAIREATAIGDRPTVVIVNGACIFAPQFKRRPVVAVDQDACNG